MTRSLEKAFEEASRLPEPVQEQLAEQMLEDISAEQKWDETLAGSQDLLEAMAEKARGQQKRGETTPKGFDEL